MTKLLLNKSFAVRVLAFISLLGTIYFVAMCVVLIINAIFGGIYTFKDTIFHDESKPNEGYWFIRREIKVWDDVYAKTQVFTMLGISAAWVIIPWIAAVIVCLTSKNNDVFSPKQQKLIYFAFPIAIFWLIRFKINKKEKTKPTFDFFEDPFKQLKDDLIYGVITPEEFEKKYSELQSKPKISD